MNYMRGTLLIYLLLTNLSWCQTSKAKFGANPAMINPSAVLELESTSKGFLLPRMSTSERDLITSPAEGLIIFNSTTKQIQTNTGSSYSPIWSVADGTPKANSTTEGKIQLAGDFTGTSSIPRVAPGSITTSKIADAAITPIKIDAGTGSIGSTRVAVASATGAVTWQAPMSVLFNLSTGNGEFRGNGDTNLDSFETSLVTNNQLLSPGVYIYVNNKGGYHYSKNFSGDVESNKIDLSIQNANTGVILQGTNSVTYPTPTYSYTDIGHIIFFTLTSETTIRARYYAKKYDDSGQCNLNLGGTSLGGIIYKIF